MSLSKSRLLNSLFLKTWDTGLHLSVKLNSYREFWLEHDTKFYKIPTLHLASSLAASAPSPRDPGPPGKCNLGKWEKKKCTRGLPESQRPPSVMQRAVRLFVSSNVAETPMRHENLNIKEENKQVELQNLEQLFLCEDAVGWKLLFFSLEKF